MPLSGSCRNLHWVFKITHRHETIDFLRNFLGMKLLRHEEFDEGCSAGCNGPYGNKWSKTMIGYGPESTHFVLELTYNYGIRRYYNGNDFQSITIAHDAARQKVLAGQLPPGTVFKSGTENGGQDPYVISPDGYKFYLVPEAGNLMPTGDRFTKVSLGVSSLSKSIEYWNGILKLDILTKDKIKLGGPGKERDRALLTYGADQTRLELIDLGEPISRKTAYGRIAFCCPSAELKPLEAAMREKSDKYIHTSYVELPTPGKATVCVVILQDPDEQEICYVDSEAFHELCQVDPEADKLLKEAIAVDPSLAKQ